MERAAYRAQRHRPLLPLQGRADGRAGADRRRRVGDRGARRQRRRPRRPPSRPTGGDRAGRGVPDGRRRARPRPTCARLSQSLGLRTWDKPAAACLASRVPYGTQVTVAVLSSVERAEAALRGLGFRQVRVRHYGDTARIEVGVDELDAAIAASRGHRRRRARRRVPLRDARPRGVPQRQRRALTAARAARRVRVTAHEAGDDDQLLGRLPRRRHAGPGPGEGRARRRVGGRGVLLRRRQPGRLPRRQDRAVEIGTGILNVFSRTATRDRPDRRRLRLTSATAASSSASARPARR